MTGRVLVAMEASGRTRDALRRLGVDAVSADVLPTRRPGPHIQGDVFDILERDPETGQPWAAMLAHPTCTYHVVSAAWAFEDPDFDRYPGVGYHQRVAETTLVGAERRAAREAAEVVLERIRLAPIAYKLVENPRTTIPTRLPSFGRPSDVLNPFEFGDDASKATCVWSFDRDGAKLPLVIERDPDQYVRPRMVCQECRTTYSYRSRAVAGAGCICGAEAARILPRWGNQTDSGQNRLSPSSDRWSERSETYPGIAEALAAAIIGGMT